MPTKSTTIYQLKIVLQGSKPPIWRRIQVKSNITLDVLHEMIQTVMGWYNVHLHHFHVHGTFYSNPEFRLEETEDESRIKLDRVLIRSSWKISLLTLEKIALLHLLSRYFGHWFTASRFLLLSSASLKFYHNCHQGLPFQAEPATKC